MWPRFAWRCGWGDPLAILSCGYGLWTAFEKFYWGVSPPGYPTLAVLISMIGAAQLIFLGVIGEYLGKVLMEVKGRPLLLCWESDTCHPGAMRMRGSDPVAILTVSPAGCGLVRQGSGSGKAKFRRKSMSKRAPMAVLDIDLAGGGGPSVGRGGCMQTWRWPRLRVPAHP